MYYRSLEVYGFIGWSQFNKENRKKGIMPIRMIARELYQLLQEVEKIEKQIENAPVEKLEILKDELRKAKAERNRIRNILEGKKG